MARPSVLPEFATSGTLRTRPVAFEVDGYPYGFPVPSQMHNWQFGVAGDWITYLDQRATPFDTLAAFIDASSVGDYGYVWRQPGATGNAFQFEENKSGIELKGLACDGKHLFTQIESALVALDANDLTSTLVTYPLSGAGTKVVSSLACNGTHLLASFEDATDQRYDLFLVDGTLLGSCVGTLGSSTAIALDGVYAYTCNANIVEQRLISSGLVGAAYQTYDHTAVINLLFLYSTDLVVVGAARVSTVGAATLGDKIIGILADSMFPIWGIATTLGALAKSVSDGKRIHSYNSLTGSETYGLGNGVKSRPNQETIKDITAVNGIGADDRFVYVHAGDYLTVHDSSDLSCIAQLPCAGVTTATSAKIVSDGDQVFVVTTKTGAYAITRFSLRSGAPRIFGHQDPASSTKRVHGLLAVPK